MTTLSSSGTAYGLARHQHYQSRKRFAGARHHSLEVQALAGSMENTEGYELSASY